MAWTRTVTFENNEGVTVRARGTSPAEVLVFDREHSKGGPVALPVDTLRQVLARVDEIERERSQPA